MNRAFVQKRVAGIGDFTFRVGGACSITLTVHALDGAPLVVGETKVCTARGYCLLEHARFCRKRLAPKIRRLQAMIADMQGVAHLLEWRDDNSTDGFKSKPTADLCNEVVDAWVGWLGNRRSPSGVVVDALAGTK